MPKPRHLKHMTAKVQREPAMRLAQPEPLAQTKAEEEEERETQNGLQGAKDRRDRSKTQHKITAQIGTLESQEPKDIGEG